MDNDHSPLASLSTSCFEAAVQNITTKLFALAEAPPFGGGGALEPQPFAGFGATPGFFGAGPSCVSASGGGDAPDRKYKRPSVRGV